MTAAESDPTPIPAEAQPLRPITLTDIRNYYGRHGVNIGDLTGGQYDREQHAPLLLQMVFDRTDEQLVDWPPSLSPAERDTARVVLARHYTFRERNRAGYSQFERNQLPRAVARATSSPELSLTLQAAHALEHTEIGTFASDVAVALVVTLDYQAENITPLEDGV